MSHNPSLLQGQPSGPNVRPSMSHDDGYEGYDDLPLNEKTSSRTHLANHAEGPPMQDPYNQYPPNQPHAHFQQTSYPDSTSSFNPNGEGLLPHHFSQPVSGTSTPDPNGKAKRPRNTRMGSWDLLRSAGGRDFEEFDVRKNGVKGLEFADGDVGKNKVARFYYYLITRSIVARWALYIVPVLFLLWVPGIIWLTASDSLRSSCYVWDVNLLWWSIWLSVFWGSWWGANAAFMMLPTFLRNTVAVIVGGDRSWTDLVRSVTKWLTAFAWSLISWISFQPLVLHSPGKSSDQSASSQSSLTTMSNILFGIFLCSAVFAAEKIVVQFIAYSFHQQTYQDRMTQQQFQIKTLVTLYQNSTDMGRSDTLKNGDASINSKGLNMPKVFVKKALKGLRSAAQTTTTALGNVATEMTGSSVLQPNSPQSMVTAALGSANKTRALARRIYYSFRVGKQEVELADVARFFPTLDIAMEAFGVLDVDGNGSATRDEIEMALMEIHRERLALASSMRDLDGAVRRLDSILVSVVVLICILILTAMVTTKLTTLVTSAGTFLLGLSWLIGSTAQEVLAACIFLFVKHPFDVGDRVDFDGQSYVVLEMNLMSTSFRRVDGKWVFLGNAVLNTKLLENIRRSGPTSETFAFEVAFDTNYEQIQALRDKMLAFVKSHSRDYQPTFDIVVADFPSQSSLSLKADIKYKTNWQQGALKVQRKNRWICAMKDALKECMIWGPAGAGNPNPEPAAPAQYTLVPYEDPAAAKSTEEVELPNPKRASYPDHRAQETLDLGVGRSGIKAPGYDFIDRKNVIQDPGQDIYDEIDNDSATATAPATRPSTPAQRLRERRAATGLSGDEVIEMDQRPRVGSNPTPPRTAGGGV